MSSRTVGQNDVDQRWFARSDERTYLFVLLQLEQLRSVPNDKILARIVRERRIRANQVGEEQVNVPWPVNVARFRW